MRNFMAESMPAHHIKVALFDVCQTLVDVYTITDFTRHFLLSSKHNPGFGRGKFINHFFYRLFHRIGLLSGDTHRAHLIRLYAGYRERDLGAAAEAYAERLHNRYKEDVIRLLEKLKASGFSVYLVSAGLDVYLRPFAQSVGAGLICTVLERDSSGTYTGRIQGTDCLGEGKVVKVRQELPNIDAIEWKESWAFGDSASDIPLLSLVGNACAVDPDPFLERKARSNRWSIIRTHISQTPAGAHR